MTFGIGTRQLNACLTFALDSGPGDVTWLLQPPGYQDGGGAINLIKAVNPPPPTTISP